ncbi:hypothetical protein CW304_19715 [Bacillus sp. UFRGS-B20]|nr:hypothetical protein CW304_19715 [Bacillus sp. UFRGS-B20]
MHVHHDCLYRLSTFRFGCKLLRTLLKFIIISAPFPAISIVNCFFNPSAHIHSLSYPALFSLLFTKITCTLPLGYLHDPIH